MTGPLWTVAAVDRKCGSCGSATTKGTPMRHFRVKELSPWCPECVLRVFEETPPEVIEAALDPPPIPSSLPLHEIIQRVRQGGLIPGFDAKRKAAGDE